MPVCGFEDQMNEVKAVRIYLDMCCYNRPYDDQSQLKISMETQAKLHIQTLIREGKLNTNTYAYVGMERQTIIEKKAAEI